MEVVILNKEFEVVPPIIDSFESLIWTERFSSCGDFEIAIPATSLVLSLANKDNAAYAYLKESDILMVIENLQLDTDLEMGNQFVISGREIGSILDRRIVWDATELSGNLQTELKRLINDNCINASDPNRNIPRLIFEDSTDEAITELEVDAFFLGETILEAVESICNVFDIGYRMIFEDGDLKFSLYQGQDRSYEQTTNPYVIFSPAYDNILNTNYYESEEPYKNVVVVETEELRTIVAIDDNLEGFDRREVYSEESGIEEVEQLETKGWEILSEHMKKKVFEGETLNLGSFTYGKDYSLGDIVQLVNEYVLAERTRVVELIRTQDNSGISIYPTFMAVE